MNSNQLQSVVISKTAQNTWQALHVPSGKTSIGNSADEASSNMKKLLGISEEGVNLPELTSPHFENLSHIIALFLEGPISHSLSFHAGWARLKHFESGIARIQLGGGCDGCPSSKNTLFNVVKNQLQSRFGEDVVQDVTFG